MPPIRVHRSRTHAHEDLVIAHHQRIHVSELQIIGDPYRYWTIAFMGSPRARDRQPPAPHLAVTLDQLRQIRPLGSACVTRGMVKTSQTKSGVLVHKKS